MNAAFTVTAAEAGQKLLQCLARRVHCPSSMLHRWIRTGQVRVNGGRRKPFDRLNEGDEVRLPPFLFPRTEEELAGTSEPAAVSERRAPANGIPGSSRPSSADGKPSSDGLPVLFLSDELVVVNKPAGLPSQPGTGHADSVVGRLRRMFPDAPFAPTPAHRLDRDTSGILIAALGYAALRRLSEAFAGRSVSKEYLAWCVGNWPHKGILRLTDTLSRERCTDGRQKMLAAAEGKAAALDVQPLEFLSGATLLHIRLLTGRTHQIRVQLASRGFPLAGDGKYGGKAAFALTSPVPGLLLHACRINILGEWYEALPPWGGPWAVRRLPPPFSA